MASTFTFVKSDNEPERRLKDLNHPPISQRLTPLVELPAIELADNVAKLTPYVPVSSQKEILEGHADEKPLKLDWNEATIAPSPKVAQAIQAYLTNGPGLNWYPELESASLIDSLKGYTNLDPEHLIVTSGSDDALALLCACFLNEGDEVVVPVPTYNHFLVFAQAHGANIKEVLPEDPFSFNADWLATHLTPRTRLAYIISPNNPTGAIAYPEQIEALCRRFPKTLFLLDEAYFEFSQVTAIELVRRFKNLIVTRTFSKAFGLAGLRVGYLAAHPELLAGIKRLYNPKSVNRLAQIGAQAALLDLDHLQNFLDEVNASKQLLAEFFDTCPSIDAKITPANFVVMTVDNPKEAIRKFESRHIFVRDRSSYPGMHNSLRMSIGTTEQTKDLINRMRELFC